MSATDEPMQEVTVSATRPQALQYLRAFSCIIGGAGGALDFADFRVVFTIRRGDFQTPNTADVRIYNLSDNTANRVDNEFTRIQIQAGYQSNLGLIFQGTIKQFRKGREDQKNSYLDVTAADGDEAYNFATAVGSLAAGHTAKDRWAFLNQQMAAQGVTAGDAPFLPKNASVRGRVYCGMTKDYLRQFATDQGCAWSIQDGQLTLIQKTSFQGGRVPLISPQSGLIGVPEQTQNGIAVRTLLNPRLKIGQLVQIQGTINQARLGTSVGDQVTTNYNLQAGAKVSGDGLYYVMVAEHQGDTRGNPWYTDLVCLAADATLIPTALLDQVAPPDADVIAPL